MLRFSSLEAVEASTLPRGLRRAAAAALARLVAAFAPYGYDPDRHGYVAVADASGEDPALDRVLGVPFADAVFEGIEYDREGGVFVVVILGCSDFGLTVLVPDSPRLSARVREKLVAAAVESDGDSPECEGG